MERSKRDVASVFSAVGFILLGIFALWGTRDMSSLGSVFPRTIGSAMIAFSAIYIVWRWFKPHLVEQPPPGSIPRRLMLVAIMVLWALLLHQVGFFVTSVVASLLLLLVANYDRWTPARAVGYVVSTLAVVGGLYSVFAFALKVPLPAGILF
jgi:hypothetical protein